MSGVVMGWAEKCFRDHLSRATSPDVQAKELFLVGIDLAHWGEQRRRVDLARALLANPTIALMVIDAPVVWAFVTTEARIVLAAERLCIKPAPYPFTSSLRKINPAVSADRATYAAQLEADAAVSQLALAEVSP